MGRLNTERESELQPKRMEYAKEKITELGYKIIYEGKTELNFEFNNHKVYFFPYSGWHSGSSIKSGRGINKLLKQIRS